MQRSALCRSRRELSNAYLLAKIGVDTAENEPCKVCPLSVYRSPRFGEHFVGKMVNICTYFKFRAVQKCENLLDPEQSFNNAAKLVFAC